LATHGVKDVEVWQALRKKRSRYRAAALSQWLEHARRIITRPRDLLFADHRSLQ